MLSRRLEAFGASNDGHDIWRKLGWPDPEKVPLMPTDVFLAQARVAA